MSDFSSILSLAWLLVLGLVDSGDDLFGASFEPKRVKKRRVTIRGKDGREYILEREEITLKDSIRGWVTLENVYPIVLKNGSKITSHLELAGSCWYCNELVALADARVCSVCSRLTCWEHSKLCEEENGRIYCIACYKKLKRSKLISGIFRFLTAPFIEKVDEDP